MGFIVFLQLLLTPVVVEGWYLGVAWGEGTNVDGRGVRSERCCSVGADGATLVAIAVEGRDGVVDGLSVGVRHT